MNRDRGCCSLKNIYIPENSEKKSRKTYWCLKSKAIAAATKIPSKNYFNALLSSILMPLLYSILTFLTSLIHLSC